MGRQRWIVLRQLKRVVKKLNFLLSSNLTRWHLASTLRNVSRRQRRMVSFTDRLGLHSCIEDVEPDRDELVRTLQRTKSCCSVEEDIDQKAEIFISNFRRQLLMERQVSLQLRYYRGNSFTRDY